MHNLPNIERKITISINGVSTTIALSSSMMPQIKYGSYVMTKKNSGMFTKLNNQS